MPNTSATGGPITPLPTPSPIQDKDIEGAFQIAFVGITGFAGANVRPRWQEDTPRQPERNINWMAFGITKQVKDANPSVEHLPAEDGKDRLIRHEDIEILCSFYGPNSGEYASQLRDGLQINQNTEALNTALIAFVDAGDIIEAPELINQKWVRRKDLTLKFRRQIVREYEILNILAADINIIDDTGHVDETVIVVQPA